MLVQRRKARRDIELQIIRDAEGELAYESGGIAADVVDAGLFEVGGGGLAGAGVVDAVVVGVFEVAVFVVGGGGGVGEVLARVAGEPFRVLSHISPLYYTVHWEEREVSYHHLDMQTVVRADVEGNFCGSYARPCGGIVGFSHGSRLASDTL